MVRVPPPLDVRRPPQLSQREFTLLRDLVYDKTGISLNDSKRSLLESRLAKCLRHHGLTSYHEYYCWLVEQVKSGDRESIDELQRMINSITTNKSGFFREPHHFAFLSKTVLAERMRLAEEGGPRQLRIWSAASSRGQEPYTIAMTLADTLPTAGWDARILATDIDTEVLDHAQQGVYSMDEIAELPAETKRRHFLRGTGNLAGKCQIKPALRRLVTFRRINLVRDPLEFRTRFDVIFLRNVMIYFNRATQQQVLERLKACLVPGGYLILGHSETICWQHSGYVALGATVYQLQEATP
jgi:chemotaxis protein methyltransferase CheR